MRRRTTKRLTLLLTLFAAAAVSGCSTMVLESHRRPAEPKPSFERTVVIVNVPEEDGSERARRAAETELSGQLESWNASPSFRFVAPDDLRDSDQIKTWATAEGFDGIVLVWFERSNMIYVPAQVLSDGVEVMPAREIESIRLKASVFSLNEDRLVWTGVVEQLYPYPLEESLPGVARAVARTLRAEGLTE